MAIKGGGITEERHVLNVGTSKGVIIPGYFVKALDLKPRDRLLLTLSMNDESITIRKVK